MVDMCAEKDSPLLPVKGKNSKAIIVFLCIESHIVASLIRLLAPVHCLSSLNADEIKNNENDVEKKPPQSGGSCGRDGPSVLSQTTACDRVK